MTASLQLLLHPYTFRYRLAHDPSFDVFALLDRAAAEGFAGVALNVNGPRYRWLGGDEPEHVARVGRAVAARGLTLDLETSGTGTAHLRRLLDLAGRLGARHLRTYLRHEGDRPDVLARTIDDLCAIAPEAAAADVAVLLENHEELTGREVAHVVASVRERSGTPGAHIAALYDYGNSMMVGEDPLAALGAMLPYVRTAHLKDHVIALPESGGEPFVAGVPIGRGHLPIGETTRRLVAGGVTRIAFENVWSYAAALRPRLDGRPREPLGAGAFRPVRAPWPTDLFLADPATAAPARLIALEEAAYRTARAHLAALGVGALARP